MGKIGLSALALMVLIAASNLQAASESRLMRYPDIHGDKIVFTYAGDIWTVSSNGGIARRLTTHSGSENFAKFSPDGETVAFSGYYDGNLDVYMIPAVGGSPKRLTYHPWGDMVLEWHPSGKTVLFRSFRDSEGNPGPRYRKLFEIDSEGRGYPERLPLWEGELTSYSPDGNKIAYNRISREFRTWKRYKGGMAQDIWLYDLKKNTANQLTTYKGTDAFPMYYSSERIYFISDRKDPESEVASTMNIYCIELPSKRIRKVTDHNDFDVKWPSIGGDAIVYENAGYLYVLDLTTEKTKKISVTVPSDQILTRPTYKNVAGMIGGFGLSKTGKRAVFEARGEIFTVPAEKGEIRNLTRTPGIRERNPAWSPDGRWIAYFSDKSGEYEIYLKKPDGSGEDVKITSGSTGWQWYLMWSPDSKKLLFSDQTFTLYYADVEAKKVHKVDKSDIQDIHSFGWSPDSKWIAYSKAGDNLFESIYLYSLKDNKSHKITSDFYDDYDPVFDPEGKYIYFISNRTWNPTMSSFELNFSYNYTSNICVATLQASAPSPFAPESDDEEIEEEKKKDEEDKKEDGKKDKKKEEEGEGEKEEEKDTQIDIEGLASRIVSIPVGPGNYVGLYAVEGKVFYVKFPTRPIIPGPPDLSGIEIMMYDMKEREAKSIISGINGYGVSADGKKIIYRALNTFGIIDATPGKNVGDGKIATESLEMLVDPPAEWKQMFNEAWRLQRDFFYDSNMHGVDWDKMKKRYGELVPYIAHRSELNYLIGELIAELNAGHAYIGGGEYPPFKQVSGGLLGCDFEIDRDRGLYRFKKIYTGKNWDKNYRAPLTQPGIDVSEGDYLLSINGVELKYPANVHALLENTVGKQTVIKVSSEPSGKDAKEFTVEPLDGENWLRYSDWVEGNRKKVADATGGRVGYIHVPNTQVWGMNEFASSFYPQTQKEGIIIDVRYNSGGWIPDMFIERLGRKITAMWARREGRDWHTPTAAPRGHLVCIINAYAGSGGDAFPYFFRQKGLGPLIGKRTWGGLVGISRGIRLMDGGRVTMPDFGFYDLEGKWDVENIGVPPDIDVDNRPDLVVQGKDPQLEKAIEVIMKRIEEDPPQLPKKPRYPIKRKG